MINDFLNIPGSLAPILGVQKQVGGYICMTTPPDLYGGLAPHDYM